MQIFLGVYYKEKNTVKFKKADGALVKTGSKWIPMSRNVIAIHLRH